jgi:hypothetical protein
MGDDKICGFGRRLGNYRQYASEFTQDKTWADTLSFSPIALVMD